MKAIRFVVRLARRLMRDSVKPPRPSTDPDLAAERLRATRTFARADRALLERARLDAALDCTIDQLRTRGR